MLLLAGRSQVHERKVMKYQIAIVLLGLAAAGLTVIIGETLRNMTYGFVLAFVASALFFFFLVWYWEQKRP